VPKIRSQELREGEDELQVGQCQQEPLVHVLREQEGPFLGTRPLCQAALFAITDMHRRLS
jgi:hypothetical protein